MESAGEREKSVGCAGSDEVLKVGDDLLEQRFGDGLGLLKLESNDAIRKTRVGRD